MHQGHIGGLSESGVLRIISEQIDHLGRAWPEGTLGPGDDAAVIPAPDGRVVISTDAMTQDVDFRLRWPSGVRDCGYSTGWKAAAQNLSDINGMGATATSLVIAVTMPSSTSVSWVRSFTAGLVGAIRHLGAEKCLIAGGDLGSGPSISTVVTVTGDLAGRAPVTRAISSEQLAHDPAAHGGFDLVHIGTAGWAAAGLAVLETPRQQLITAVDHAEHVEKSQLWRDMIAAVRAQLRPRPPLYAGPAADEGEQAILAMLDVSDGLSRDSTRLAERNGLVAELDENWLRHRAGSLRALATALGETAEDWVRHGGEDYGLLGVIPAGAPLPQGWLRCGRLVTGDAAEPGAPPQSGELRQQPGWDHFSS